MNDTVPNSHTKLQRWLFRDELATDVDAFLASSMLGCHQGKAQRRSMLLLHNSGCDGIYVLKHSGASNGPEVWRSQS